MIFLCALDSNEKILRGHLHSFCLWNVLLHWNTGLVEWCWICCISVHCIFSHYHIVCGTESRTGNASLRSSYLISVEVHNLYKNRGWRKFICIFWLLMKATRTSTCSCYLWCQRSKSKKEILHYVIWVKLFKLGFMYAMLFIYIWSLQFIFLLIKKK